MYGEPTGGWVGDSMAGDEDHVMLSWEVWGEGQRGGWRDMSNDMVSSRTNGLSGANSAGDGTEPTWMPRGCYPLCQKTPPPYFVSLSRTHLQQSIT